MPFVSDAQRRWGNSPAGVKALGGKEKVAEWESHATKGRKLPEKVKHKTMKSSHSIHKHTSAHDKMSVADMHKYHPHKMHPAHPSHLMHKHFVAGTKGVRHVGASGKVEHKTMSMGDHE